MNTSKNHRRGAAAFRVIPMIATAAALAAFAGGCSKKAAQQGQGGAPVTEVGVVTLKAEPVTLTKKLPGRTVAYRVAEVRARVNGIVQKRLFEEGATVREGQQLYQIDDAPYIAALESAKAALARAEASLSFARAQAGRYESLVKTNSISRQEYDNAQAQAKAAAADVEAGKAAVTNAQINLGYTKVYAPISGRIGKSEVTEGAYVQAGAATLLAVVQQLDPLYVDIVQPAGQVLKLAQDRSSGKLLPPEGGFGAATLYTADGQRYDRPGKLQFTDVTVQQSTSSVFVRAEFPNPPENGVYALLPGLFVRAEIIEGISPDAVLVPQQGVTRNAKGQPTTYVVGKNDKGQDVTELRVLTVDRTIGDKWLVTSGVKAGEQVIVENLLRIRQPGQPVKPVPAGQNSPGSLPIK